jgi:hypothetical protein
MVGRASDPIDLVCPVIARDLDRFRTLLATWHQFWRVPGRFVAAVRAHDLHAFRPFHRLGVEIVTQEDLLGHEPFAAPPMKGWYQQQMVKLAFSRVTTAEAYIAIDADCFFARRQTCATDVFPGGVIPYDTDTSRDAGFYRTAAVMLGVEEPAPAEHWSWRPPFGLDTATVRLVLDRLEAVHHAPWQRVCRRFAHCQRRWDRVFDRFRRRRLPPHYWTEMLLYQVGVASLGREARHVRRPWTWVGSLPFGASHEDQLAAFGRWDLADAFTGQHTFGLVQSYAGIPPRLVRDRILPHLASDAAAIAAGGEAVPAAS